jgi:hypothetical protein
LVVAVSIFFPVLTWAQGASPRILGPDETVPCDGVTWSWEEEEEFIDIHDFILVYPPPFSTGKNKPKRQPQDLVTRNA